jgi:hypothetical protein
MLATVVGMLSVLYNDRDPCVIRSREKAASCGIDDRCHYRSSVLTAVIFQARCLATLDAPNLQMWLNLGIGPNLNSIVAISE